MLILLQCLFTIRLFSTEVHECVTFPYVKFICTFIGCVVYSLLQLKCDFASVSQFGSVLIAYFPCCLSTFKLRKEAHPLLRSGERKGLGRVASPSRIVLVRIFLIVVELEPNFSMPS